MSFRSMVHEVHTCGFSEVAFLIFKRLIIFEFPVLIKYCFLVVKSSHSGLVWKVLANTFSRISICWWYVDFTLGLGAYDVERMGQLKELEVEVRVVPENTNKSCICK